jgi:uncharacterized damage-inducible protein DinB
MNLEELMYPIGKYQVVEAADKASVNKWIKEIETLPKRLKAAVKGFNARQLNTPYRPEGWTVRQVIHHIADSHMNAYIRFKLTLTEDKPVVKPYDEKLWSELPDINLADVKVSIDLIKALHIKWSTLLKELDENDLNREFIHPESGTKNLRETIGHYAWHGNHHLAHIISLKQRMKW